MTDETAGPVFAALSDSTRREVIRRLAQEPATATELAIDIPVSRQAIVKHLSALAEAGLVRAERRGREVHYQLTPEPLSSAVAWITDLDETWSERLAALQAHLDEMS